MDVEQLLAEVEHLDENALAQLKEVIARRERKLQMPRPSTVEEWGILLNEFIDEFWGDTPADEQNNIIEAIRIKNIPADSDQ